MIRVTGVELTDWQADVIRDLFAPARTRWPELNEYCPACGILRLCPH